MIKKWLKALCVGLSMTILIAGCSKGNAVSAEEIISNVLEADKKVQAYYGESTFVVYENGEKIEEAKMEEYVNEQGQIKVITHDETNGTTVQALNDGKDLIIYEDGDAEAQRIDISDADLPTNMSQKQQLMQLLEMMNESHDYETIGEEKILGIDTHHVKLTEKEENSLFGNIEVWIDQKTWFVVKHVSESGDMKIESEYVKLDFSPKFTEDTFQLDLPEGVTVKQVDEGIESETVTIEEATERLGQPFLILQEEELSITNVEIDELEGTWERTEVNVNYEKDGLPFLSISIFETPEDAELEHVTEKVRGHDAEFMKEIDALLWDEDGLRYVAMIVNPDIELDEVKQLLENMTLSEE